MKRRRPALSTHCDAILDANNAGGGNRCDGDGVEAILTCVVTADSEIYTTASRLTTFAAVSRVMFAGVKFRDRAAACFQSFMAVQMYISAVETDVAPQRELLCREWRQSLNGTLGQGHNPPHRQSGASVAALEPLKAPQSNKQVVVVRQATFLGTHNRQNTEALPRLLTPQSPSSNHQKHVIEAVRLQHTVRLGTRRLCTIVMLPGRK